MMRFKLSLVVLLLFGSLGLPLAAQDASSGVVAITDRAHITVFANGAATDLAEIPAPLPIEVDGTGFEYAVSSDHQWVMQTSYWPAVVAYGQVGEPMAVVPLEDDSMSYYLLSSAFSPDNRFLVFTVADNSHWMMGFVTLESGELSLFEGSFAAIEPDLSPDLPFGNMVPTNPAWSADGSRVYLETLIPFWGCRGPHDLYAIDISASDLSPSMALPRTEDIARLGTDMYSFAFSPDRLHLAYVFEDESCSYAGARALALTDLTSETDQVLIEAEEGYNIEVIEWLEDDMLLYSRNPYASLPTLYLYNMKAGQSVELPALRDESGVVLTKLDAQDESLFFSLADEETYNPSYPSILYHHPLNEETVEEISASVMDWMVCGDNLYVVTPSQESSMTLLSYPLASLADDPLELDTAKTIQLLSCSESASVSS